MEESRVMRQVKSLAIICFPPAVMGVVLAYVPETVHWAWFLGGFVSGMIVLSTVAILFTQAQED